MSPRFRPAGYPGVSAYVMANSAQGVAGYLRQTFDAEELRRLESRDGRLAHAEVRVDDTVVMIADGGEDFPAFPTWPHVYVPDVDATYQRALSTGGTPVQEPAKQDDPDRRGGVKDPAGNTWWIATQVE